MPGYKVSLNKSRAPNPPAELNGLRGQVACPRNVSNLEGGQLPLLAHLAWNPAELRTC